MSRLERFCIDRQWDADKVGSEGRHRASQGVGAAEPDRDRLRRLGGGGWRCRSGKQQLGEEAFISDGGGRMGGKGGGWLAGSQIMPMSDKGRAC